MFRMHQRNATTVKEFDIVLQMLPDPVVAQIDHDITLKNSEFILNSIEKVKPGFLLSSMCRFLKSNGTKA